MELDHKLYTSHYSQRSSVSAPAKKFNEEVGRWILKKNKEYIRVIYIISTRYLNWIFSQYWDSGVGSVHEAVPADGEIHPDQDWVRDKVRRGGWWWCQPVFVICNVSPGSKLSWTRRGCSSRRSTPSSSLIWRARQMRWSEVDKVYFIRQWYFR